MPYIFFSSYNTMEEREYAKWTQNKISRDR